MATALLMILWVGTNASTPVEALVRDMVVRTALTQLDGMDQSWQPAQRDCAGLVRHAYREAFRALWPEKLSAGPWRDRRGAATAFADAETLVAYNFAFVGRDEAAVAEVKSGDLIVFRQEPSPDEPPVFHLLIAVRPFDRAHHDVQVVYHPGTPDAAVRVASLSSMLTQAPKEWQPAPENRAFLGIFRLREWMPHD
jgi:uncharacterized protein